MMFKTRDLLVRQPRSGSVLRLIMEADVDSVIGAGRHERVEGRTTYRNGAPCNGYRDRSLDTWLGTLNELGVKVGDDP